MDWDKLRIFHAVADAGSLTHAGDVLHLSQSAVSRQVRVGQTPVELAKQEFALLSTLASEPTRVFTKHELLRDVWGFRCAARTRTIDSHACRLRSKLRSAGDGHWIENVWGIGYRMDIAEGDRELA